MAAKRERGPHPTNLLPEARVSAGLLDEPVTIPTQTWRMPASSRNRHALGGVDLTFKKSIKKGKPLQGVCVCVSGRGREREI